MNVMGSREAQATQSKGLIYRLIVCVVIAFSAPDVHAAIPEELGSKSDDLFAELEEHSFSLYFRDALTGKPIAGAKVSFEGKTSTTDAKGRCRFKLPDDAGMDETRKARFNKHGYVLSTIEVQFLAGSVFFANYSISPALPPGKLRVVLDWAERPADLDAHLIKKGGYHISWRKMRKFEELAKLDIDAQRGFGPETITIEKPQSGATYSYSVHDYTHRAKRDSKGLQESRARVVVFSPRGVENTFTVPRNAKGHTWSVFQVRDGQIHPIDTVGNTAPR